MGECSISPTYGVKFIFNSLISLILNYCLLFLFLVVVSFLFILLCLYAPIRRVSRGSKFDRERLWTEFSLYCFLLIAKKFNCYVISLFILSSFFPIYFVFLVLNPTLEEVCCFPIIVREMGVGIGSNWERQRNIRKKEKGKISIVYIKVNRSSGP